jgi:hypothetical protein
LKKEIPEMAKKTLETSDAPQVVVENVGSDLQVKGWDRNEILVKSSSDNDIVLEEREDGVFVACHNDCVLYVPQKASVEVRSVGSGARFRSVDGAVIIEKVGSDLSLRDVGSAQVGIIGTDMSARRVREELSVKKVGSSALVKDVGATNLEFVGNQLIAKSVRGDLQVDKVGSNMVAHDIDGQANFDDVGGNLHLRDVSGGISAVVGGAATVDFSPVSWQAYDIKAGSKIRCNVPADANVQFDIECGAQSIRIKGPQGSETIKEKTYTYTMGEGSAPVKLTTGGGVEIVSQGSGMDDVENFEIDFGVEIESMADEIAQQTSQQIEAQMEMLEEQLNTQMASLSVTLGSVGMSEERMKEVEERLAAAKERAARRAEEASRRAQEKLERKLAAAERKAERKARTAAAREARKQRQRSTYGGHGVVIAPPSPRQPATDPVSEEERLMILQMLQDQKISVDQAEQLLSALEGK